MRGCLKSIILILVCLAILLPFASGFPDGLEKVAKTLGIQETEPKWTGLMPDYAIPSINNSYISTLFAGFLGVFIVLVAAFLLGKAIAKE
jgi:ABC-type sulfate transport system permease component